MGRPKGAKNIRTFKVEEIASRYALDPFEVLMQIAVGDWKKLGFDAKTKTTFTPQGIEIEEDNVPLAQRCNAAKEAVKYLYPQKREIQRVTKEEAIEILENELKNLGTSE
jgi:hypothetical protein